MSDKYRSEQHIDRHSDNACLDTKREIPGCDLMKYGGGCNEITGESNPAPFHPRLPPGVESAHSREAR